MSKILYLDASGDPGRYKKSNAKHFVIGGLAVDPECSLNCAIEVRALVSKYFPDPNVRPKKVHCNSLVGKKYPWNLIDRKAFADDVFTIIESHDMTIFGIIIDKEAHWKKYAHPVEPYSLAIEMMVERYQHYLAREDELGLIVSDRENGKLMNTLIGLFERFKEQGTDFVNVNRIIDTIFFAPSYTCAMLQLADFCAYSIYVHYERNHSNRYGQLSSKFDKYGIKVFP